MRWPALWFLFACERGAPSPVPAPPSVAPRDALKRIEDLPKLADYRDPKSPYDCTVISAMQTYFAGTRVESYGMLEKDAAPEAVSATTACVAKAITAMRPVIFAQAVQGTGGPVNQARVARASGRPADHAGLLRQRPGRHAPPPRRRRDQEARAVAPASRYGVQHSNMVTLAVVNRSPSLGSNRRFSVTAARPDGRASLTSWRLPKSQHATGSTYHPFGH